jgi:osmoprotectant transport system permease protein
VHAVTVPVAVAVTADARSEKCYTFTTNEWVCGDYLRDRGDQVWAATVGHLYLTVAAVALGLVLAVPLALLAPVFVHLAFYKLLRVPLPAGVLPAPW